MDSSILKPFVYVGDRIVEFNIMELKYDFLIYLFILQMDPSCCVDVELLVGQYGMWWPMKWNMVCKRRMGSPRDPCLASSSASSLPMMLVCALIFRIVT